MQELELAFLEYEELVGCNGNIQKEGIDRLKEFLTIRQDGNVLYICHPRHLFPENAFVENFSTKEIVAVDWEKIDLGQMKSYQDFGQYSIVEQICNCKNNALTYLHKRAVHMMKRYKSYGSRDFHYPLVVLEEVYHPNGQNELIVRGIVSYHQDGFKIAINPQFEKNLSPQKESVWEKGLRFGGNN